MKKQAGKLGMGITCLMLGGICLFNPVVALVDVLPDLIGYLLFYVGLWRLSDLNDEFAAAFSLSRTLMWIGALELAFVWVCYSYLPDVVSDPAIEVAPNEVPMAILLCATVSAVLRFCFLIPMFRNLFAGFATAAIPCNGCAVAKDVRGIAVWERIRERSVTFVVIASILAVLPELTVLTSINLLLDTPTVSFDWYRFAPLMRGFAATICTVVALVWIISYLRFFIRVKRDVAFCESLSHRYRAEVLVQPNWLLYRRYSVAFFWATVGLIFSAHLTIDNRSILPGFVCAVFLCIAVSVLGVKKLRGAFVFYTSGVALAAVSLVHEYYLTEYVKNHDMEDALHLPRAYEEFYRVRVLECAEAVFTCIFLLLFFVMIWQTVKRLCQKQELGLFSKGRRKFAVRLGVAALFAIGAAVVGSVNAFLQLEIKYLWWFVLLLSVVVLLVCRSVLMEIKEEILSRAESDRMHKRWENDAY